MKSVFSLKVRAEELFNRWLALCSSVKALMIMPLLCYLAAFFLITMGFNQAQTALLHLSHLEERVDVIEEKLARVWQTELANREFVKKHNNVSEEGLNRYIGLVCKRSLEEDLAANHLRKSINSSVLSSAPKIAALMHQIEKDKTPMFKASASLSRQKGSMLERQLKLARKVSLQERAFYALIDGLEQGLHEDSPSILIKKWTVLGKNKGSLELTNMHLIEREKIDHEK